MSLETPRDLITDTGLNELRIITLHSKEPNTVILNHQKRLPFGVYAVRQETIEDAARRIAQEELNLEHMTSVARVTLPDTQTVGYVIEAAHGHRTDLRRSFAGRAFALADIFKGNPEQYNGTDLDLLWQYARTLNPSRT